MIFLDNVETLKSRMTDEVTQRMGGWLKFADKVEVRAEFDRLVAERIDDFLLGLMLAAIKLLGDNAGALKEADTAWRKANPQRAAEFPLLDMSEILARFQREVGDPKL